jgi:hypothetical protein
MCIGTPLYDNLFDTLSRLAVACAVQTHAGKICKTCGKVNDSVDRNYRACRLCVRTVVPHQITAKDSVCCGGNTSRYETRKSYVQSRINLLPVFRQRRISLRQILDWGSRTIHGTIRTNNGLQLLTRRSVTLAVNVLCIRLTGR